MVPSKVNFLVLAIDIGLFDQTVRNKVEEVKEVPNKQIYKI